LRYFINLDVENQNGDVIADVDDLLVDLNTGRILYVIVNYGDFLDLTTEDRPMPLSAFGWNEELELVLKLLEETLANVPAVEDEWPANDDAGWNDAPLAYWQETEFAPEFDAEVAPVRISNLIGLHAGQLGEDLGVVEDILLDLSAQQMSYLGVYATDDFYSPDLVLLIPLVAADLTAETVGSEPTYAIALLEIDPEVLNAAPALDRAIFDTADFIDQSFTEDLNAYWQEHGIEVGTSD
jgi:sporulation protein YlmC with PRC-barrel domain